MTLVISDLGSGMFKSETASVMAGMTVHTDLTFAADGKDYVPVTTPTMPGSATIAEAIERVNDTTYKVSVKVKGLLIATILEEVSADGKTLTTTTTGVGQFAAISNVVILDKK
jgi:hypothetical protein